MQGHRSLRVVLGCVAAIAFSAVAAIGPSIASARVDTRGAHQSSAQRERAALAQQRKLDADAATATNLKPKIVKTNKGPTGYQVTFRYYDPTATSVRLRGEWFFSNAGGTTTTSSLGLLPSQWAPGDFPIANPNQGAAPNWPVASMTENQKTGIWSYTTPMPAGTYTYGFYVNCSAAAPALSGCTELSDPSNPPWNASGSVEPDSQIYVPSDAKFGAPDMSWEKPHPKQGQLIDGSYTSPQSTNPVGTHPLAVFLPKGYNPNRAIPYPTLYLSHGSGGNEVDWTTQGAANSILDNLMSQGVVQPMVIVMTDFNNLSCTGQSSEACYATDLVNNVIPYVQSHYNVSTNANARAFAGLSAGGDRANYLLFNDTSVFDYMGSWSIGAGGAPATTDPSWSNPQLRSLLGLQLGGGLYDSITIPSVFTFASELSSFKIPYTVDLIPGGHEWYTWRQLLHDYLTTVVFKHTTTAVATSTGGKGNVTAQATISASTAEPNPVTGTVQFSVNGQQVGGPVAVRDGAASAKLGPLAAGTSVSATYSGDPLYSGSVSTAATTGS
jgi:enterochelin esterase-like enzyme